MKEIWLKQVIVLIKKQTGHVTLATVTKSLQQVIPVQFQLPWFNVRLVLGLGLPQAEERAFVFNNNSS